MAEHRTAQAIARVRAVYFVALYAWPTNGVGDRGGLSSFKGTTHPETVCDLMTQNISGRNSVPLYIIMH